MTTGGSGVKRLEGEGSRLSAASMLGQPSLAPWLLGGLVQEESSTSLQPPVIHTVAHKPIRWSPFKGSG